MPILGYKKTGFLQIIEPKIIIRKAGRNNAYITAVLDKSCSVAQAKREELKLKSAYPMKISEKIGVAYNPSFFGYTSYRKVPE